MAKAKVMAKRLTTEQFIEKAQKIHGNKYDYSLVEYRGRRTPIKIICPKHGSFEQTPNTHYRGSGCPKCGRSKSSPITPFSKFLFRARQLHGDKYDYDPSTYYKLKQKMVIICPIHGQFLQTPLKHLEGHGCPKCAIERNGMKHRMKFDDFVRKARVIHGNKYEYINDKYGGSHRKTIIVCPIHGPFEQTPLAHFRGHGCYECAEEIRKQKVMLNNADFVNKAIAVHHHKYDYSKVQYKGTHHKITIICPTHGEFKQSPNNHLRGCGCPKCSAVVSTGHQEIIDYIKSIYEGKLLINSRKAIYPAELDIYLPEIKLAVEYNGRYWHHLKTIEDRFYHQKKHLLCKEKGIRLIQIDEHLWKRKRKWFEKLIKDAIEGVPLIYNKSKETILVDARYDDGTSLLKEGYRLVKLTKPYRIKLKRYIIYDAGRYIYKRGQTNQI